MKTITLNDSTWKTLSLLKIEKGYNSIDDLINSLIERSNLKNVRKEKERRINHDK
jgi:predicted CopG family antitoxin